MTDSFRTKIDRLFDRATNLVAIDVQNAPSDAIRNLIRDKQHVFPIQQLRFHAPDEHTIEDAKATFRGTTELPFQVAGSVQSFPAILEFFFDDQQEIQLRLRFEIHQTNDPRSFSLSEHWPKLDRVFGDLEFTEFAYVIVSKPALSAGVHLESGLNADAQVSLLRNGTNPLSSIAFLWKSIPNSTSLRFGGPIDPPGNFNTGAPILDFKSPGDNVTLSVGIVAFLTTAFAQNLQNVGENGVGVDLRLPLSTPLTLRGLVNPNEPQYGLQFKAVNLPQELLSLAPFNGLLPGISLDALEPAEFPLSDQLDLEKLHLLLMDDPGSLPYADLDFAVKLKIGWTLFPDLATLNDISIGFYIGNLFDPSQLSISPIARANTTISDGTNQGTLLLQATLPGINTGSDYKFTFSGSLVVAPEKSLNVFGVLDRLIPGIGNIPQLALPLSNLQFSFTPADSTFSLAATVKPENWDLPLGLTITEISGYVNRTTSGTAIALSTTLTWTELGNTSWTLTLNSTVGNWSVGLALGVGSQLSVTQLVDRVLANWNIQLPASLNIYLSNLSFFLDLDNKSFRFAGTLNWSFDLIGYQNSIKASLDLARDASANYSGQVVGIFQLLGFNFGAAYRFGPGTREIEFQFEQILATYSSRLVGGVAHRYLSIRFGNTSLGDIIAAIIRAGDPSAKPNLDGPWAFLGAINLNGLVVEIDFTSKTYRAQYRIERDFTLLRLDSIVVEYRRQAGKPKFQLQIEGKFFGKTYDANNPLAWDPVNDAPPATPGAGKSAFDLHYLAFGQRVAIRGATQLNSVEQVLAALAGNTKEVANPSENPLAQLPGIEFNAGSGWLIATRFVVNRFLTVAIVFNDPQVYGALVIASGVNAGVFNGLRFEILYRKVTDTIGQFHIDLTLPIQMRRLQLGPLTLGITFVSVDVYTNGDFELNLGFPKALNDYSRCVTLELFPFTGLGGFYFAKLSAATATGVPSITNGRFDPVIRLGVAISIGLGKSFELGILSGGISISVIGIVEGVFARFEPQDQTLPTDTYFALQGMVAIVGRVFGKVDFKVIQAAVDITARASITLRVGSYQPVFIALDAGVSVSVSVTIFWVEVSFSFQATVHEEFTIGSYSRTPWTIGNPSSPESILPEAPSLIHPTYRARRRAQRALLLEINEASSIRHLTGQIETITLWATPVISQIRSQDLHPSSESAHPVSVTAMFFMPVAAGKATSERQGSNTPARLNGAEQLLSTLLLWMLEEHKIGSVVTAAQLGDILSDLQRSEFIEQHFAYDRLIAFLNANLHFRIEPRPTSGQPAAAFFPMIPQLTLAAPGYQVEFGKERLPEGYLEFLESYFRQLEVSENNDDSMSTRKDQSEREARTSAQSDAANPGNSMAGYLFTRFFLASARAAVQAAADQMEVFQLELSDSSQGLDPRAASLTSIANFFEPSKALYRWHAGDSVTSVAAWTGIEADQLKSANARTGDVVTVEARVTPFGIVEANQTRQGILREWPATNPIAGPQRPTLSAVILTIRAGESFVSVGTRFGFDGLDIAIRNRSTKNLFATASKLTIDKDVFRTKAPVGATLQTLAAYYKKNPIEMVQEDRQIRLAEQSLSLPEEMKPQPFPVPRGSTLAEISQQTGVSEEQLQALNHSILVEDGAEIRLPQLKYHCQGTDIHVPYIYKQSDTLESIARHFYPEKTDLAWVKQQIRDWNPNFVFDRSVASSGVQGDPRSPEPGDVIHFPYEETLDHIAIYFYGTTDLTRLLSPANTQDTSLLAPGAKLAIPEFPLKVDDKTTFADLAARFGLSLEELALKLAAIPGLFRDPGPRGPVQIAIPAVPAIRVTKLAAQLQNKFRETAAGLSWSMLHGLRLPATSEVEAAPLVTGETYPLYVLNNQQFAWPEISPPNSGLTFGKREALDWVEFPAGSKRLRVPLSSEEITRIDEFRSTVLDLKDVEVKPLRLAGITPARQSMGRPQPWRASQILSKVIPSNQDGGNPSLWQIPQSLQGQVSRAGKSIPFGLYSCRDRADGSVDARALNGYAWATAIKLNLQQVTPTGGAGKAAAGLYTLFGSNEDGQRRLFELCTSSATEAGAHIYLLYQQNLGDRDSGFCSDFIDTDLTRVFRTNLSSTSRPAQADTGKGRYWSTFSNANAKGVMKLLWESSVGRSGGFYLAYQTREGAVLPNYLFNAEGKAEVTLLVVLNSQIPDSPGPTPIYSFNNIAVVGEAIDVTQETLCAEPSLIQLGKDHTLAQLVRDVPNLPFDVKTLIRAQAHIPGLLREGADLHLPDGSTARIQEGDSWATLAKLYHVDLDELAQLNHDSKVFRDGTFFASSEDLLLIRPLVPPGVIGFEITRPRPDTFTAPGQKALQELFNLAGFAVTENDFFHASREGLPVGPTEAASDLASTLAFVPSDSNEEEFWRYHKALRIYELAKRKFPLLSVVLPLPEQDPYSGIYEDSKAEVSLAFQDIGGGRTSQSNSLPRLPLEVGYTDELIGVDQWPSLATKFRFSGDGRGKAELLVPARIGMGRYLPGPTVSVLQAQERALADRSRYQAIHYQLSSARIEVRLETTMGSLAEYYPNLNRARLLDLEASAWVFLSEVAHCRPFVVPGKGKWAEFAAEYGVDSAALAEANANLKIHSVFDGQALEQPQFVCARDQDSIDLLVRKIQQEDPTFNLAELVRRNETLALCAGTTIIIQPITVPLEHDISLQDVLSKYHVALMANQQVPGLLETNPVARLQKDQRLEFEKRTYTTEESDTLAVVAAKLNTTADAVALANPNAKYQGKQSVTIPNRILQPDDTLLNSSPGWSALLLAEKNRYIPNLFTPGTQILRRTICVPVASIPNTATFASEAAVFGLTLGEFAAWQAKLRPVGPLTVPCQLDTSDVSCGLCKGTANDTLAKVLLATRGFSEAEFLRLNADYPGLFAQGREIRPGVITTLETTFRSLAEELGISIEELFKAVKHYPGLLREGAVVFTPALLTEPGDTLRTVAERLGCSCAAVGEANGSTLGMLKSGQRVHYRVGTIETTAITGPYETLAKIADSFVEKLREQNQNLAIQAADVAEQNPELQISGGIKLLPPISPVLLRASVTPSSDAAIRPLRAAVTFTRPENLIHREFKGAEHVRQTSSVLTASLDDNREHADPAILAGLDAFAREFEQAAFPGFKLASGSEPKVGRSSAVRGSLVPDSRISTPASKEQEQLWAVRFGSTLEDAPGFSFHALPENLAFYSLPPLSTKVWNAPEGVMVEDYESGRGLTNPHRVDVQGAVIDEYAREFLATIDQVLSPIAAHRLLDLDSSLYTDLVHEKEGLADAIASDVAPIVTSSRSRGDADAARETLRQQLAVELSSAYSANSVLQLPFEVHSPCDSGESVPQLSGTLVATFPSTGSNPGGINLPEFAAGLPVPVDAEYLARLLADLPFIVAGGTEIERRDGHSQPHTISTNDTLGTIASALGVDVEALANPDGFYFQNGKGILASNTTINISPVIASLNSEDTTVSHLSDKLDVSIRDLLKANWDNSLFAPGSEITLDSTTRRVPPPGSPSQVAALFDLDSISFAQKLASADLDFKFHRPYVLDRDAKLAVYRVPPIYSISTGKLALASNEKTPQFVSVLMNIQNPALGRFLPLNLEYKFTHLEYNILPTPTVIKDAEQSCWLRFVLPFTESPSTSAIFGPAKIPVPLRDFPEGAVVTEQNTGLDSRREGSLTLHLEQDPKRLPTWDFQLKMQRLVAAQDIQELKLWFNLPYVPATQLLAEPEPRKQLYEALTRFHYVAAAITPDLLLLSQPTLSESEVAIAKLAAQQFLRLASDIATSWPAKLSQENSDSDTVTAIFDLTLLPSSSDPNRFDTLKLEYKDGPKSPLFFINKNEISESDDFLHGLRNAFQKRHRNVSEKAALLPQEGSKQKIWWLQDVDSRRTYELEADKGGWHVSERIVWPEIAINSLPFSEPTIFGHVGTFDITHANANSGAMVEFSFKFKDLDLLISQNARVATSVRRNSDLITGVQTDEAFIYRVPQTAFPGIAAPSVLIYEVNLRDYDSSTLLSGLSTFFENLSRKKREADESSYLRLSLRGDFEFPLKKNGSASYYVGPPLLLAPEVDFYVKDDWRPTEGTFVYRLASELTRRAKEADLPISAGRYTISLRVYSTPQGVPNSQGQGRRYHDDFPNRGFDPSEPIGSKQTIPLVTYRKLVYDNSPQ